MKVSLVRLTRRQWACIPEAPDEPRQLWREVSSEDLELAIDSLDPETAEVLRLYRRRQLRPAEIAELTGVSVPIVLARMMRGCQVLRRVLRGQLALETPAARRDHVT
jgi:DNA-directed RNA polymerase specialized sigma24 family protein